MPYNFSSYLYKRSPHHLSILLVLAVDESCRLGASTRSFVQAATSANGRSGQTMLLSRLVFAREICTTTGSLSYIPWATKREKSTYKHAGLSGMKKKLSCSFRLISDINWIQNRRQFLSAWQKRNSDLLCSSDIWKIVKSKEVLVQIVKVLMTVYLFS